MTTRCLLLLAVSALILATFNTFGSGDVALAKMAGTSLSKTHLHSRSVMPLRIREFLSSEGVNTHLAYTDGGYAHLDRVIAALGFLGITHVRDSMSAPGQYGSAPIASYETVAHAGIRFTLMVGGGGKISNTGGRSDAPSLDQRIGFIAQLQRDVASSVFMVEGTNEVNNQPIIFDDHGQTGQGSDELDAALAFQLALYAGVHAEPALKGVPVAYFTGYAAGTIPLGPDPVAGVGLADLANQHPYPNDGQPPAAWVARARALPNVASESAPAIYTETGYSSNGGINGSVNLEVQSKYTLDLLLDTAKYGIQQTDLYELFDAYDPGSPQGDAGWGLFDSAGGPKPVATAIHTMNAILDDTGKNSSIFALTPLGITVSSESTTSNHLLMQKSDGSYVLALWDEQPIWDGVRNVEIPGIAHKVSVSISGLANPRSVVFDPLRGIAPLVSMIGSDIVVLVIDHPLFLLIRPDTTP